MLKAQVFGIPSPSSKFDKFLEFSRGESLWVDCNDIAEIQYEKSSSTDDVVHSGIFDYPERNNYNSITNWLKYNIDKGMLVFSGKPTYTDLGKLIVRIFHKDDMIVREFGIEVSLDKGLMKSEAKLTMQVIASETTFPFLTTVVKDTENETKIKNGVHSSLEKKENLDLEIQVKNNFTKEDDEFDIEEYSLKRKPQKIR